MQPTIEATPMKNNLLAKLRSISKVVANLSKQIGDFHQQIKLKIHIYSFHVIPAKYITFRN